jgi:putative FmdB family regulatory protein
MPIYEYVCEKCGDHIEAIQKVGDPPLKRCKKCRGKLEKVVSRTSFQLKGSGWYMTDYSSKPSSKSTDKAEKTDSSPEKSKSDKGTEKSGGAATD